MSRLGSIKDRMISFVRDETMMSLGYYYNNQQFVHKVMSKKSSVMNQLKMNRFSSEVTIINSYEELLHFRNNFPESYIEFGLQKFIFYKYHRGNIPYIYKYETGKHIVSGSICENTATILYSKDKIEVNYEFKDKNTINFIITIPFLCEFCYRLFYDDIIELTDETADKIDEMLDTFWLFCPIYIESNVDYTGDVRKHPKLNISYSTDDAQCEVYYTASRFADYSPHEFSLISMSRSVFYAVCRWKENLYKRIFDKSIAIIPYAPKYGIEFKKA